MVRAGPVELEPAENVDVGGVALLVAEAEPGGGGGEDGLVVGGDEAGDLLEVADARGPAGPDAKLDDLDGQRGGADEVDDADDGVGAAGFDTDVFADEGGLEVGDHAFEGGHGGFQSIFQHADQGRHAIRRRGS